MNVDDVLKMRYPGWNEMCMSVGVWYDIHNQTESCNEDIKNGRFPRAAMKIESARQSITMCMRLIDEHHPRKREAVKDLLLMVNNMGKNVEMCA